jgi:hypothetical protein
MTKKTRLLCRNCIHCTGRNGEATSNRNGTGTGSAMSKSNCTNDSSVVISTNEKENFSKMTTLLPLYAESGNRCTGRFSVAHGNRAGTGYRSEKVITYGMVDISSR